MRGPSGFNGANAGCAAQCRGLGGVETRPNLLVVLCDQLRRDALGAFGDPNVATPHLDRLAKAGVSFTAACSSYPIRVTLMTGKDAHSRFVSGIEWRMSPAERALAEGVGF